MLNRKDIYKALNFFHLKFPYSPDALTTQKTQQNVVDSLSNLETEIIGYWSPNGPLGSDRNLQQTIYQKFNIPQLYVEDVDAIKRGALIGIFPETSHIGQAAAKISYRVLNGESANTIPIERLTNFTVAVNVSTAIEFELPIPSDLLQMAQGHVYH